jgi:hypothetical protein
MLFLHCSWLSRKAVPCARSRRKRLRPPAAPLRLEHLEDRLAPADLSIFPPIVIADPGPSSVPPNLPTLQPNSTATGTIQQLPQSDHYALALPSSGQLTIAVVANSGGANTPHITLQESDGGQVLASTDGTATVFLLQPSGAETYVLTIEGEATGPYQVGVQFTPLNPMAGGSDPGGGQAPGPGEHRFLTALAAAADSSDSPNLGDGTLRSFLGNMGGNAPALAVALEQRIVSTTTTMVARTDPVDRGSSFSAGILASASSGESAGLLSRFLLPSELPGFSAFSTSVLMTSSKDRAMAFELSPYSPAGPDIVPIPVPRGLEDWLAEFLGSPSQGPGTDGRLGAGNDVNDTSLRDAVFQMLQEGWAPPGKTGVVPANVPPPTAPPSLPALPKDVPPGEGGAPTQTTSQPNAAARDAVLAAAPPPDEEAGGPAVEPSTGSMLAAFAVGLGQVGWREWHRDERTSRRRR